MKLACRVRVRRRTRVWSGRWTIGDAAHLALFFWIFQFSILLNFLPDSKFEFCCFGDWFCLLIGAGVGAKSGKWVSDLFLPCHREVYRFAAFLSRMVGRIVWPNFWTIEDHFVDVEDYFINARPEVGKWFKKNRSRFLCQFIFFNGKYYDEYDNMGLRTSLLREDLETDQINAIAQADAPRLAVASVLHVSFQHFQLG